jgi:hypothetical protein
MPVVCAASSGDAARETANPEIAACAKTYVTADGKLFRPSQAAQAGMTLMEATMVDNVTKECAIGFGFASKVQSLLSTLLHHSADILWVFTAVRDDQETDVIKA